MSRLKTHLEPFHECPKCRYPMVQARGFRIDTAPLLAISNPRDGWQIGRGAVRNPGAASDSSDLKGGGFVTNTPWTWFDTQARRWKLARLKTRIAQRPNSLICPNCIHLEP